MEIFASSLIILGIVIMKNPINFQSTVQLAANSWMDDVKQYATLIQTIIGALTSLVGLITLIIKLF